MLATVAGLVLATVVGFTAVTFLLLWSIQYLPVAGTTLVVLGLITAGLCLALLYVREE